jgi:lysozyme family protein
MRKNFGKCLSRVLVHEGGYVNDPVDPGGATNKGVTQAVYDGWRQSHGQKLQSVQQISVDEIAGIYRLLFWDRVRGDDLPSGLDYAVFDFAVNSGANRSAKYLQAVVGVGGDGLIGKQTLEAVARFGAKQAVIALCNKRQGFLRGLKIFWRFGKGWTRRVDQVRSDALQMVTI